MEKIDFLSGGSSNDSKLLLACANGIPYAIRLCTNCCSTTATSYINLATGVSSNTPPSGLSIGECADITCPPIYETESFVAAAGQTSFNLSHSPYKDVDFTRNGATLIDSVAVVNGNTVTYVPSENNNINLLAGDDITISYLYLDPTCTEYSINSVICFDFVEGGVTTNIKVVSINNAITYYENGEKISDATRISEVEQLVVNANADNVVCCPDCGGGSTTEVNSQICYEFTEGTPGGGNITANGFFNAANVSGAPTSTIRLGGTSVGGVYTAFSSPVVLSTNGVPADVATVQTWANGEFLTRHKAAIPFIDSVYVQYLGAASSFLFWFYDSTNPTRSYAGTCAATTEPATGWCDISLHLTYDGGAPSSPNGGSGFSDGSVVSSGSTTTTNIKVITVNGVTDYYEEGVKVTDTTRISEIEALVAAATPSDVVCCLDCGGGSDVTVTDTVTGHQIATIIVDGVSTIINETITSIEINNDGSFTFTDEAGVEHIIPLTPCKSYFEKQTFIATAGQTSFTLLSPPNGDIHFSRNGSTLSDLSATVSGNVVTYVPNQNNNEVLLAGDRIDISYVYVICDATVEPFVDCIGNEILNGAALVQCSALDPTQFNIDPTTGEITVVTTNLTDCAGNDLTKDTAVVTCAALNPSDFNIDPNTGLISTVDYTDCVGNELESGTSLVTCAALNPEDFEIDPTTGQISVVSGSGLTDCIGNPIANGESVVKCEALNPTYFTIDPTTGIITPVAAPTITRAGVYATFENKTILPNTLTQITAYNTVSDTSAGAWNSTAGTFTAPRAGWYDITANVSTLISAWVAGSENTIAIYKNGVRTIAGTNWFHLTNGNTTQSSAYAHQAIATGKLYLNAGDVIDVRHFHTSQTAKSTWTPERSNFSIVELGTTL